VCEGAMIYEMPFPVCCELYLSTIFGKLDGDTKMPEFGGIFVINNTILTCPTFKVDHYASKRYANTKKDPFFNKKFLRKLHKLLNHMEMFAADMLDERKRSHGVTIVSLILLPISVVFAQIVKFRWFCMRR
jgi:hypothetical protein